MARIARDEDGALGLIRTVRYSATTSFGMSSRTPNHGSVSTMGCGSPSGAWSM